MITALPELGSTNERDKPVARIQSERRSKFCNFVQTRRSPWLENIKYGRLFLKNHSKSFVDLQREELELYLDRQELAWTALTALYKVLEPHSEGNFENSGEKMWKQTRSWLQIGTLVVMLATVAIISGRLLFARKEEMPISDAKLRSNLDVRSGGSTDDSASSKLQSKSSELKRI